MDKQKINNLIKGAYPKLDNKIAFFMAGCVWDEVRKWHKAEVKKAIDESKPSALAGTLTDEERALELTKFLDAKLLDGSLSAAELAQFKDIYGLKAKERDITIRMVEFRDVYPDYADRIDVTAEMIKKRIEVANES